MRENEIGTIVIDSAYKVHSRLGPGLLERSYQKCLVYELIKHGLKVNTEVYLPLQYKNKTFDCGYRLDIWIEEKVVLEIKTVDALKNIHVAQLLTYLKLTGCKLGYLLNFNTPKIKYGIKRVVNRL